MDGIVEGFDLVHANVLFFVASDAKKCRAYGRGIQPKGVRTGDVAEFRVITKDAGEGVLKVTVTGPGKAYISPKGHYSVSPLFLADGADIFCRTTQSNSTTYECSYMPNRTGNYTVSITYGGAPIFKSPFPVAVASYKESRIRAFGPGLEGGAVGFPADFVVETNGETGSLGKRLVNLCKDRKDRAYCNSSCL
jgi:filamin